MKYIYIILTFLITGLFIAFGCSKDPVSQPDDTSPAIDYSNIENLYEQPLEVIQKCLQGKWKLQYSTMWGDGFDSHYKIIDIYGYYMHLTPDHIIMGNDSLGVNVDSPIRWLYEENSHYTGKNSYILTHSHYTLIDERDGVIIEEREIAMYLLPIAIKNDTLRVWDCGYDTYHDFYLKVSN